MREIRRQQTVGGILERLRYKSVAASFTSHCCRAMQQGLKEHMAIIEAVTSRDTEVAERTMRQHLISVIGALHQLADMGVVPHLAPAAARS